jgi:hypothetical protein
MCQGCSDSRCAACCGALASADRPKKLSMAEQIALFNSLNPELGAGENPDN